MKRGQRRGESNQRDAKRSNDTNKEEQEKEATDTEEKEILLRSRGGKSARRV